MLAPQSHKKLNMCYQMTIKWLKTRQSKQTTLLLNQISTTSSIITENC